MRKAGIMAAVVVAGTLGAFGTTRADSVYGEGGGEPYVYFAVGAASGPGGENASGNVVLDLLDQDAAGLYYAEVSLLCVSGNQAVLSGAINTGAPLGYGFILHVQDNASEGTPDLLRWELVNYVPATCPTFAINPAAALNSGDIVIVDEEVPPPPPPPVTFDRLSELAVQYVLDSYAPGCNGVANALAAQLAAAKNAVERGNDNAKAGILEAFISTVSNLERFLEPWQMDELIEMAGQL